MRWAGHVAHMRETSAYRVLVGKPEGKRPLGRFRHRREDNINIWILRRYDEVVWTGLFWIRIGTSGGLS
jgi:hypothetical protein